MNNFVSLVVALLEHLGALSEQEAKKLIKELHGSTLPDNYEACSTWVKNVLNKHEIKNINHKLKVDTKNLQSK